MPVLPKDVAAETAKAETGFSLMEENDYELELLEVQTEKNGQPMAGAAGPYWTFVFQIPEDAERYKKRRFWVNFSHSEKAAPIRKSILDAFGAASDVNTDDLIGQRVLAHIKTVLIEKHTDPSKIGEPKDDIAYFVAKKNAEGSAKTSKGKSAASPDNF